MTLFLAVVIAATLFAVLYWVKTPWYRVDAKRMRHVLEMVLTGQASANDWTMTFGMVIRHSAELEAIRQACCVVEEQCTIGHDRSEYLFSAEGLKELALIHQQLINIDMNDQ
jgi:hypothetical protein